MPEPQPIPVLARIQPYKPAAKHPNPRAALAANENPHGASPHAIHAAQQELQRAQCYPAGGAPDLVQALAKQFNLKHKQLICGAGSDELIYMINLAYAGEKEAVLHPQYGFAMYRLSALTARAEPIAVKLDKNDRLSIPDLKEKLNHKPKILFFATPENPIGAVLPLETIQEIIKIVSTETLIVIDCAYAEYMPQEYQDSLLNQVDKNANVVILRTFSKAYGLAGLRVGWAYAHEHIIENLHRVRHPFNVSRIAIAVACAALEDQNWIRKSVQHNNSMRKNVEQRLLKLGLQPRGEGGNFVRFDLPLPAAQVEADLAREGILLRSLAPYDLPDTIRMTLGRQDEVDATFAALEPLLAHKS